MPKKDLKLEPGGRYAAVLFEGCGFLLPFHFGVALCLRDHNVTFDVATGVSGGAMAALAALQAADLHVGIRQCFDLRQERSTILMSIAAFRATYRQYFLCFRHQQFRASSPVKSLENKLRVILAMFPAGAASLSAYRPEAKWYGPVLQCAMSTFNDENELADAFMATAYIPAGTALLPARVRGQIAFDAMIPACLGVGDHCRVRSSQRATHDDASATSDDRDTQQLDNGKIEVLSVPCSRGPFSSYLAKHGKNTIVVQGPFHTIWDFWTPIRVMRESFVSGYLECQKALRLATPAAGSADVEARLEQLLEEQRGWKEAYSFEAPELVVECDSVMFILSPFIFLLIACVLRCLPELCKWVVF